jgi:hypothetical protein
MGCPFSGPPIILSEFPLAIRDFGHFRKWPLIGPLTDYRAMPSYQRIEEPRAP